MNEVALGDVATIRGGGRLGLSGKDFVQHGVPAYGAGGQNGFVEKAEGRGPAIILSSIGARCGKCFLVEDEWTTLANTQLIVPNPDVVNARYLWHQLNDEYRWPRAGTGQPFIKPSDVKNHRIEVPTLEKQLEIVSILDLADRARAQRRRAIDLCDALRPSLFENTFRSLDFPKIPLGTCIAEQQVGLNRAANQQDSGRTYGYVKMDSIGRNGRLNLNSLTRVDASASERTKYALQDGDLLFNTRNSRELVGKSAIFKGVETPLYNNNLMRVRFDGRIMAEYVHGYLWSSEGRRQLDARKSGTTNVFAIYYRALATVSLPVPPMAIQKEFAERIARTELLLQAHYIALEKSNQLFAALRAQAFGQAD